MSSCNNGNYVIPAWTNNCSMTRSRNKIACTRYMRCYRMSFDVLHTMSFESLVSITLKKKTSFASYTDNFSSKQNTNYLSVWLPGMQTCVDVGAKFPLTSYFLSWADAVVALQFVSCVSVFLLFEGDSLSRHLGQKFSTRDQDNDVWPKSCAVSFQGAWWYAGCHASNLNGLYLRGRHSSWADGVEWQHWTGLYYSLRFTEMKIRPFRMWIKWQHISTFSWGVT